MRRIQTDLTRETIISSRRKGFESGTLKQRYPYTQEERMRLEQRYYLADQFTPQGDVPAFKPIRAQLSVHRQRRRSFWQATGSRKRCETKDGLVVAYYLNPDYRFF